MNRPELCEIKVRGFEALQKRVGKEPMAFPEDWENEEVVVIRVSWTHKEQG